MESLLGRCRRARLDQGCGEAANCFTAASAGWPTMRCVVGSVHDRAMAGAVGQQGKDVGVQPVDQAGQDHLGGVAKLDRAIGIDLAVGIVAKSLRPFEQHPATGEGAADEVVASQLHGHVAKSLAPYGFKVCGGHQ